jgi:broad specificity phosphatase PhoE
MMDGNDSHAIDAVEETGGGSSVVETSPKALYMIRHGTSLSNEFMQQPGNGWGEATFRDEVTLRDARLSPKGRRECDALAGRLARQTWLSDVELVVVSPLRRCLETAARGVMPALVTPSASLKRGTAPTVIVLPWITERVYTMGDIGTSPNSLRLEWPTFDWSLVQDEWWYREDGHEDLPEWRPHGQGQWYAVPGEPMTAFQARMASADAWLRERSERHILLVTHWAVIRHYTSREVANCEVAVLENWDPSVSAG